MYRLGRGRGRLVVLEVGGVVGIISFVLRGVVLVSFRVGYCREC